MSPKSGVKGGVTRSILRHSHPSDRYFFTFVPMSLGPPDAGNPRRGWWGQTSTWLAKMGMVRNEGSFARVQPSKASSREARLPDLRAIVAATTLQSRAISSLLASLARLTAIE
jgi:hypothetical protein